MKCNQIRSAQWTVQKNKKQELYKGNTTQEHIYGKKKSNKSKMCNTKVQNNKMCKKTPVYWDLINSDMNRRDVQTGYSGYVHKKNGWWVYGCIFCNNLVGDYETGFVFRSPMAWGKKLLLSLSVFAIMLLKRLPDGSKQKRWLPGWFESLMIFTALLLQRLR